MIIKIEREAQLKELRKRLRSLIDRRRWVDVEIKAVRDEIKRLDSK